MNRAWVRLVLRATAMLVAALGTLPSAVAQRFDVETRRGDEAITVEISTDIPAGPRTVWSVITDYDRLARFIPYMSSSRVLKRDGHRLIVEQTGAFVFLFYRQPVQVRLAVAESPPGLVVAHAIGGNLKEMEGRFVVQRLTCGDTRLSYSARLVPAFEVPPIVGRLVVRSVIERQFNAMVAEIVRRDAERPARHGVDRDGTAAPDPCGNLPGFEATGGTPPCRTPNEACRARCCPSSSPPALRLPAAHR